MEELTVLFFALLFRSISICVIVGAAAFLMYHDKNGWGWLILVALIVNSYRYTPDKKEADHCIKGEA
jgi:hypothetical protein